MKFLRAHRTSVAFALAMLSVVLLLVPTGLSQTPLNRFSQFRRGLGRPVTGVRPRFIDLGAIDEEELHGISAPFAILRGSVKNEAGAPAAGVVVRIESKETNRTYKVTTDKNGKYTYTGLQGGEYLLGVEYMGRLGLLTEAILKNGREASCDFELRDFNGDPNIAQSLQSLRDILAAKSEDADPIPDASAEVRELYARAREAATRGDFKAASVLLKELTGKVPGEALLWRRLGESYLQLSDFTNAASAFRKAMELKPLVADYPGLLALSLLFIGDFDEALRYTEITASLDKASGSEAYYNLGLALTDGGEAVKAEAAFSRALQLNENHPGALFQLGITLLSTHPDLKDAKTPLERFLSLMPEGEDALTARLLIDEINAGPKR
ncbi:MAG TPA: tetratricopeptide repeat protein [Terriglobia bacterium]|nr:tetratricopeptide repeat protein [Terriglobia bacterium]